MSYIGRGLEVGSMRQLDDISSSFDGSTTAFTMQINSVNVDQSVVGDVNQLVLSLGGVIQEPGTDFTVSGSTLTFTTAPAANLSFFCIVYGGGGGFATPGDKTVTESKFNILDGKSIKFGTDDEIELTHNADKGLILKHTATADDKPVVLTLQTGETDMAANDVIGKIEFQAPDEGTGTDAILVSGAIQAVAEGDHSSSSNATRLEFMTGASEAAASKMTLSSGGVLDVDGGVTIDNITIDGTEIDLSSGDLTLDVAGDILLDADGGDIKLRDGGSGFAQLKNSSSDLIVQVDTQDKDIKFNGDDGGSAITALTLDMSDGGAATLNNGLTLTDGNLVVAAGHGIDFTAQSDTATGESVNGSILNDYEQGTFTANPTTTGTDYTTTSRGGAGFYTKIGDWVHCEVQWFVTTPSGTASSGSFIVSGMPFVCNAPGNSCNGTMASFGRTTLPAADTYWPAYSNISDNASSVYFYYMGSQSGVNSFEADNLEGLITPYGAFAIGYPCD